MANPFYYDETTKDRLQSLVGWRICPIYPGAVPSDVPNVQPLVKFVHNIVLDVEDGQTVSANWNNKERHAMDVFLKCSYMHCPDLKAAFLEVTSRTRKDCLPFKFPSTKDYLNSLDGVPGFVFILHNHHATATIVPKSKQSTMSPSLSSEA